MHRLSLHGGSKHSFTVMQKYNNTEHKCSQCSSTFFDDKGYGACLTCNKVIDDAMQVVQQTTWIHHTVAVEDENTLVCCLAGWWIDWLGVNSTSHLVALGTLVCRLYLHNIMKMEKGAQKSKGVALATTKRVEAMYHLLQSWQLKWVHSWSRPTMMVLTIISKCIDHAKAIVLPGG
eukprot:14814703-Ditylum_brightwellii.AAC.1